MCYVITQYIMILFMYRNKTIEMHFIHPQYTPI